MKSHHHATALALALALASFGTHAQTQTAPAPRPSNAPAGITAESATSPIAKRTDLAAEDERFLEKAIQGSHAEIVGSQLAFEKTENADVRTFAQMMIEDHGKMVKEADTLATRKGMTPPTGPSMVQSTEITAMKALSGGAFDAMYVNRIGVASHEATVDMFEKASREAQDPDIKALATKTLAKLREHLEMARSLKKKQDQK